MSKEKENSNNITLAKVVSGGFWLYLDTILMSLIGYLYWVLIGIITGPIEGPTIIGYASTTISLAGIITSIANFGIPIGIQRFLGKAYGENNYEMLKRYFIPAILFIFVVTLLTSFILFAFNFILVSALKIEAIYIILAGILVLFNGLNTTLKSFLLSILRTKQIFVFDFIAQLLRLGGGIYLVIIGFDGVGAVLGFVLAGVILTATLSVYTLTVLRSIHISIGKVFDLEVLRELFNASVVSWLPNVITIIGTQIGILVLFSHQGALSTGVYYIAYAIFLVVLALPNTFLSLLFPVLSGLESGHASATKRTLNLVLVTSTPLAAIMAVYSPFILGLVGTGYISGATILTLLSLSIPLACVVNGIRSLVYALGEYNRVLILGSAISLTRIIFYFYLVPLMGGLGTAISFDLGFIAGFFVAVVYSYKHNMSLNWLAFSLSILIPFGVGWLLYYLNINWLIGSIVIILVSGIIFARAKLYTMDDIRDITMILLPKSMIKQLAPKVYPILKLLFGE